MLSLSFCVCGKRYTHEAPVIDAEAEKPMEDTAWSNTHNGRITMEEIQEAKLAVVQFLRYMGADFAESFSETLPDPILVYHEVRGDIWEFRTYYGRFDVTRQNPRVTIFSRHDSIPCENIRPPKPEGYAEEEALEVAKALVRKMIPNFDDRNFVLEISHEKENHSFWWHEHPGGEIISVPPNNVSVLMDREHLCLEYYSALDYHHWRTTPPKISEKQAKDKAEKVWHGKGTARKAMLWERVRKGGKEIRTVWTVGVFLPNPEGGALEDVVIDADTGEVVAGGP
jgi:hypothetical protein